jgi:hypothetical protein
VRGKSNRVSVGASAERLRGTISASVAGARTAVARIYRLLIIELDQARLSLRGVVRHEILPFGSRGEIGVGDTFDAGDTGQARRLYVRGEVARAAVSNRRRIWTIAASAGTKCSRVRSKIAPIDRATAPQHSF